MLRRSGGTPAALTEAMPSLLPNRRPAGPAPRALRPKSRLEPVRRLYDPPAGRLQPVILLVDDDTSVRESLHRVISLGGWTVVTARDGEQALEQLATLKPDLVVTDLCMGAISGWDLVFHHHLNETGVPFFVITALSLAESGGVEKLADGFFQKPLDLEVLLQAIQTRLTRPTGSSS